MYQRGILIMISYEIGIGFAIGRLISVFHEMALRLTGLSPRNKAIGPSLSNCLY